MAVVVAAGVPDTGSSRARPRGLHCSRAGLYPAPARLRNQRQLQNGQGVGVRCAGDGCGGGVDGGVGGASGTGGGQALPPCLDHPPVPVASRLLQPVITKSIHQPVPGQCVRHIVSHPGPGA